MSTSLSAVLIPIQDAEARMGMDSFPKLAFFILVGAVIAYPISGLAGIIGAIIALWCIAVFFGGASRSGSGGAAGHHGHGRCRRRCRRR